MIHYILFHIIVPLPFQRWMENFIVVTSQKSYNLLKLHGFIIAYWLTCNTILSSNEFPGCFIAPRSFSWLAFWCFHFIEALDMITHWLADWEIRTLLYVTHSAFWIHWSLWWGVHGTINTCHYPSKWLSLWWSLRDSEKMGQLAAILQWILFIGLQSFLWLLLNLWCGHGDAA